jgi:glycosyltransferase involved in cell wall biosynthesis
MRVVISLEHRFVRTPDGVCWTRGTFTTEFWQRYLTTFDAVRVVARVLPVSTVSGEYQRADGPQVTVHALPCYHGPWEYLRQAGRITQAVDQAYDPHDAYILRVPGQVSRMLATRLHRHGHPYAVEVVGDPYDVYAPGAIRHPARPLFRWWFSRALRRLCAGAVGVAYVNEGTLPRRYPVGPGAVSTSFSSITLREDALVNVSRTYGPREDWTLVMVGSLEQLYKAPDVLIDAVAACRADGLLLRLVMIGDGRFRSQLEERARALGLHDHIQFRGLLPPGAAVRAELDAADLFVLPSRTEGLPRAMIEAMARGLPCIGSTAGGIPELLPPEDLVPIGDSAALARTLHAVCADPARLTAMSARNLARARDYGAAILDARRRAFYAHVHTATAQWQGEVTVS